MQAHFGDLKPFGWSDFFEAHFHPYLESGYAAGRIAVEHKQLYRVYTASGELLAELAGKLRYEAASREQLPAVGDWVVIQPRPEEGRATIQTVLPRRTKFARKRAGQRTEEQIVGANIDTVFLVTSLNQDFNLRRLERYLVVAWESGARPVILLSKADLCEDVASKVAEVEAMAMGVAVHPISAVQQEGLEALAPYFQTGQTAALLGTSGVGKSTLINHLLGYDRQKVREVREHDDCGRHTTTYRELILLPRGGLVLDTPGMRELQLWSGEEGIQTAFDEIEALAQGCYFRNCQHRGEPGCAVQAALDDGTIDPARYQNYEKLQRELGYLARKQDVRAQIAVKKKWKKLSRLASQWSEMKRRGY
jgi:ribosome biogenesis GTPase